MRLSVAVVLAVAVGAALAVVAEVVLIAVFHPARTGGSPIDVTKLAFTVVGGVGGVVALVIAYRRQRDLEQNRFVERFGAAAAQLGATDVAVRLAGVYAMAGVADESDGLQRQQCIDVLCGYLRLPYDPELGRSHQSKLVVKHHRATADGTQADDQERHLEYRQNDSEVRKTILRVIADRLRSNTGDGWSASNFDFRTAHLEDADLRYTKFTGAALFDRAMFTGETLFIGATFAGSVQFNNTTFSGETVFNNAKFASDAHFNVATFSGTAWFVDATFSGAALFADATFARRPWFSKATFSAVALFHQATFSDAQFGDATFTGPARFENARFADETLFSDTTFVSSVCFDRAAFSGPTWFGGATFAGSARFCNATFAAFAGFGLTTFTSEPNFAGAVFAGKTSFVDANLGTEQISFVHARGGATDRDCRSFGSGSLPVAVCLCEQDSVSE
ncbi:pentapeptide repeat-containing protein [Nocardia africana]|uniref:Pentapeptide repeat-containing protein n=1 Tax=Nocardia africana TaxID=134964 RepID=A0ABW6NUB5_9NOCA